MQPGPITIGWALSAALLIAEHIALWSLPWRLKEPWSYVVGVGTLGVGWIAWALTASGPISPIDAVASVGVICSSGVVILLAYYVRGRLGQTREAAQQTGEIIGAAKGLTQALIDGGGKHAGQSGLRDRGRSN
jgi:hypothetical protein